MAFVRVTAILMLLVCVSHSARAGVIDIHSDFAVPENFSINGRKWEPGPNSATWLTTPGPGGATFSIAGSGIDLDPIYSYPDSGHVGSSVTILDLGVAGFDFGDYVAVIDWALDTWAAVSGFSNLGYIADSGAAFGALESDGAHLADIRVSAWEISSSSVLAHAYAPGTQSLDGFGGTILGDLHFDVNRVWVDDPTDTNADGDFDFHTVALHEIGHAIGLSHSTSSTSVMYSGYTGAKRTLSADDIAGIQTVYGPLISTPSVPEPSGMLLLALGTAGLIAIRRRRALRRVSA